MVAEPAALESTEAPTTKTAAVESTEAASTKTTTVESSKPAARKPPKPRANASLCKVAKVTRSAKGNRDTPRVKIDIIARESYFPIPCFSLSSA